jgi:diguanylate cyclase (GGDEF)-like protein
MSMTIMGATDGQSAPAFVRRVLLPVVIVTLSAVVLAILGLYWATTQSDAVSIERQTQGVRNAIKTGIDEVVQSQKMIAVWDQAVLELGRPAPDWDWVDENMAIPLRISFGHSQFYVLGADDTPIHAVHEGVRVNPTLYESIKDAVKPLVETVRGRASAPVPAPDSIGLPPSITLRDSDSPLYAAGLMSLFRRPAAVSVMRNVPRTENIGRIFGQVRLIVSIRFLDSLFLQQMSSRHLIEAPRFSRTRNPQRYEEVLPLIGSNGDLIGYMSWRPELPGTKVMHALAPITALTTGMMVLIMTLLGLWLFRSMRQQRNTMEELKAREAQAQQLALHDTLTGLPNRAMLSGRLDQTLACGRNAALLLLDLDRFKHVNDTLGHPAGDMLIREFGHRLAGLVRDQDTVARLGGDEFAILCVEEGNAFDIDTLCQRILRTVGRSFNLAGTDAFVGVSIGVCAIPSAGSDRIDIMRKADIALYRAKAEGRNCYRIFTPAMDEMAKMRGVLEAELRAALASGEGLVVHYQPQVRCADQMVVGLEALLRWHHPAHGLVSPAQFITIAEETGIIRDLGELVLRQSCATAMRWPDLFIAINLSPVQLRTPDFVDRVMAIVQAYGIDPGRIELEVTESVLLDDSNAVRSALEQIRTAGFRIALDDFGTGYSSLSYLRRFHVDKIKIDRSFIQPVGDDADAAAIVTAVLTLGHAMGLTVTAEGVETQEQQDFLTAAGCDIIQGYLFSPAVPESQIERVIGGKFARTTRLATTKAPGQEFRKRVRQTG